MRRTEWRKNRLPPGIKHKNTCKGVANTHARVLVHMLDGPGLKCGDLAVFGQVGVIFWKIDLTGNKPSKRACAC